ncbi:hypothetical protein GY31_02990 [Lysinibacillus sphaericus]|uniref:competence type IV pilus minor pilin ComGF n=1 Tax=Lysinibacillus TaxID=400634 RepID=UPI00084A8547|nr:competence type IV pilus minor pilin ComGF [Lysinibacillus sphaericus]OEC03236.1 hypothetical protein GY31_02990 [Lysinibacillus sphaericus]
MNDKGYTLLEALIQMVVFVLVCHVFILIILWALTIKTSIMTDEHSKWELFVFEMSTNLANATSLSVRQNQRTIMLQTANTWQYFDCYHNMIRQRVNGGHVPMLVGINNCQFQMSGNELTIAVEFPSGLKKERTYFVPIIEK